MCQYLTRCWGGFCKFIRVDLSKLQSSSIRRDENLFLNSLPKVSSIFDTIEDIIGERNDSIAVAYAGTSYLNTCWITWEYWNNVEQSMVPFDTIFLHESGSSLDLRSTPNEYSVHFLEIWSWRLVATDYSVRQFGIKDYGILVTDAEDRV